MQACLDHGPCSLPYSQGGLPGKLQKKVFWGDRGGRPRAHLSGGMHFKTTRWAYLERAVNLCILVLVGGKRLLWGRN